MSVADRATQASATTTVRSDAPVVLYDGACGLCDRYVQFVLKRDQRRGFRFAPLQGSFAREALARHHFPAPDVARGPSTIVLLEHPGTPVERIRVRSDAVLAIVAGLGGPWRLAVLLRLVPRPLRDVVYRLIARARFRLFGAVDSCAVPAHSAADEGRFLV